MVDSVADARRLIEDRLAEVEAEARRLRDALASLRSDRRPGRTRGSTGGAARARSRRTAKRAPRGQREAEFLAALEKHPGAKVPEIAKEMGVAPNQVYGLAGRLHKAGKIRKRRGGGYAVKNRTPSSQSRSASKS